MTLSVAAIKIDDGQEIRTSAAAVTKAAGAVHTHAEGIQRGPQDGPLSPAAIEHAQLEGVTIVDTNGKILSEDANE